MSRYILQEKDYQSNNPANCIESFDAPDDKTAIKIADDGWSNWRKEAVLKRVDLVEVY